MMRCKHGGLVSGILLILISMWPNLMGAVAGKWISLAIGIILVLHGLACRCDNQCCANCEECSMEKKPAKKRRR